MIDTSRALLKVAVWFVLILTQVNTAQAQSSVPYSASGRSQSDYDGKGFFASWGGRLSPEDQNTFVKAIHMVLNNAEAGVIAEWEGRDSNGMVRILYSQVIGNGYCRVFESRVMYNNDVRRYIETACLQEGYRGWVFYNK
jgi:surface antigen